MDKPTLGVVTKKRKLEQDLAHISQEMYKRNAELADINRTLSLLREIDTLVLASHDSLQILCNQITAAMVSNSEYAWVAIYGNSQIKSERLDLLGWSTAQSVVSKQPTETPVSYLSSRNEWAKSPNKMYSLYLANANVDIAKYLHCSPDFVANLKEQLHVNALYFVRLMARGNLVGVMVIGFPDSIKLVSQQSEQLIDRLSEAVGVALDNKLLFEENQRIVIELQKTNQKLRALDETKDEFISMASHQLRTPLTSVKGYISMVLEGDAGKITENQRKLLDQSFISAQRMVYLIADLLNVSRLKTGKFIIDAEPTNLADLVESELKQLIETAKSHNLTLTFNKPPNFPLLMLDETKTRQVVMNFADNAIYYTPKGGHINITLEDKPESVEFKVIDDGIGVPKAEQHQLFGKFYRAGNAKKARPDGTGLGLFMAQKVIVTQGGSIIFHSEEGHGSTFGFSFPKAKLKVPDGAKVDTSKNAVPTEQPQPQ